MGYSFSPLVIFKAIILNAADLPALCLKGMPLRNSPSSLQTSIAHCTGFSPGPSVLLQNRQKGLPCPYRKLLASRTLRVSLSMCLQSTRGFHSPRGAEGSRFRFFHFTHLANKFLCLVSLEVNLIKKLAELRHGVWERLAGGYGSLCVVVPTSCGR